MVRMLRIFLCVIFLCLSTSVLWASYIAGQEAYRTRDYATAFREFKEDGTPNSHYMIGIMYENGEGVAQDKKEAANWFQKSAEKGFAPAQYRLGRMYEQGEGVPQDINEAIKWYRKAAGQGNGLAKYALKAMGKQ